MIRHRILCFGDSNTHGSRPMAHHLDWTRHRRSRRWPGVMADLLGDAARVIEEGQPGRTTVHDDPVEGAHKNGARVLPALLESHRPLDLVIVMLGTNDLKARFGLPAGDIAASHRVLLRRIATSQAGPDLRAPDVLLVAPIPIAESGWLAEMFAGGAAKSRALPSRLRDIAADNGAGFFDAGTCGSVDPMDGVHLSADTHRALGTAMAEAVRARLG